MRLISAGVVFRGVIVAALLPVFVPACRAQFSADYQTNIISGVVSNWHGDNSMAAYYVGSNTSFDVLRIDSGGVLSNGFTFAGSLASASNNGVIVAGRNSALKSDYSVFVGYFGADNSLTVSDGAKVLCGYGSIGEYSSNNVAVIRGTGTVWQCSASAIVVGGEEDGTDNKLIIQDGAKVVDQFGNVGAFGGSSNFALVTGAGSIWSNTINCWVGNGGTGNSLVISNGGMVASQDGYLGSGLGSNNTVLVTGGGSVWSNSGTLSISYAGTNNTLTVCDGGSAMASNLIVGGVSGSQGTLNILSGSVRATRIRLANQAGSTGIMFATNASVVADSDMLISEKGDGAMYLSNSTASAGAVAVTCASGPGTLTSVDSTLTMQSLYVGFGNRATGTVWMTRGHLVVTNGSTYVCYSSPGQMTCSNCITDLATLTIGYFSNMAGTLNVSGGSLIARQFDVGHAGIGSTGAVWIANGADVTATNDASFVGESGIGTMTVSNSTIRLAALTLAKYFLVDTYGTLTVVGGTVTLTGTLTAGEHGFTSPAVGNKGVIWLTGGQVIATNAPFYLGITGTGQMNITNGTFIARSINIGGLRSSLTLAGGTITVAESLVVDGVSCSQSGTVAMMAGNLFVTNAAHTGTIEVRAGTLILAGGSIITDQIIMTDACAHFARTGGTLIYGSAVLTSNLDADGDGMVNGWEQAYGLDPLNAADASADNDGDGFTNLQEFQTGTDPTNSASAFRILSVVPTNNDVLVSWATGGGRTNVVLSVTNLAGSFTNSSPNIILPGSGDVTTNWLDAGAATNGASRFYRIRLVP